MPALAPIVPEAVRQARSAYLEVKVAHGICRALSCHRPAKEGSSRCERCLARGAKSQLKIDSRNRQAKRDYAKKRRGHQVTDRRTEGGA